MKKTYNSIFVLLFAFGELMFAQSSPDSLFNKVKQNNKGLKAAYEQYNAEVSAAKTGLFPSNPELEIGYLLGNPDDIGNRTDFSVSQSFDFPSAYIHKSKLANTIKGQAELKLKIAEQEILAEAKKIWIERLFLNQKQIIISKRLTSAEKLNTQYQKRMETGDVNILQLNQVSLRTSLLRVEYNKLQNEIKLNQLALEEICGGEPIAVEEIELPTTSIASSDSILKAYDNSLQNQLQNQQLKMRQQNKNVVFSKNLPKFTLGYYSERLLNEKFRGFKLGLSIPLWENKSTIKQAKSEILFAEAAKESFYHKQKTETQKMIDKRKHLQIQTDELSNTLSKINNEELLTKALDLGEISLNEFYYELDFYFRSKLTLLDLQKEQLLVEAELLKVFY